jgi:hypothetical protein
VASGTAEFLNFRHFRRLVNFSAPALEKRIYPMEPVTYWNKELETLPREKLEELQLRRFRKQMQYVYDHSPMCTGANMMMPV